MVDEWRRQDKDLHVALQKQVDYAARASKKLSRGSFHAMARFGPKLDREQLLLSRFVGSPPSSSRSARPVPTRNGYMDQGKPADEVLTVANYFCNSAKARIDHQFAGTNAQRGQAWLRVGARFTRWEARVAAGRGIVVDYFCAVFRFTFSAAR